jgi:hypothetical protein
MSGNSLAAQNDWKELKSEHFILSYKNAPLRFVEKARDRAESIYRDTTRTLGFTRYKGWTWSERVKIAIFDDVDDYQTSSGYDWSAGMVSTSSRSIKTFPSAQGFFDSVLPHELGHIIFREFIGQRAIVPLWLEEGVAMYLEDGQRLDADNKVRQALKAGQFISLKDLGSVRLSQGADPALVSLFYAQAASVVNFLINKGEEYRFARLANELRDGARFDLALKRAYMRYQTIEDLEEDWKGHLFK